MENVAVTDNSFFLFFFIKKTKRSFGGGHSSKFLLTLLFWLVIFPNLALNQIRLKEVLERAHFRFICPRLKKLRPEGRVVCLKALDASGHSWD